MKCEANRAFSPVELKVKVESMEELLYLYACSNQDMISINRAIKNAFINTLDICKVDSARITFYETIRDQCLSSGVLLK